MKIAILILSTLQNPSTRNIEAIKDTYISLANSLVEKHLLKNEYSFFFYYAVGDEMNRTEKDLTFKNVDVWNVYINGITENIYNTFEKGILMLKEVPSYDWYIRANISTYINIPLLDKVINLFDKDCVYTSAINTLLYDEKYINDIYPRGDFSMFSGKVRDGILQVYNKFWRNDITEKDRLIIPHVDDCMFGLCLIEYFGNSYFKHIEVLTYNFLPGETIEGYPFNFCAISTRVKTIPPDKKYSGYSWDDNEYRKLDGDKMKICNNLIKDFDYDRLELSLTDLFVNKRKNVVTKYLQATADEVKLIIENKRKRKE